MWEGFPGRGQPAWPGGAWQVWFPGWHLLTLTQDWKTDRTGVQGLLLPISSLSSGNKSLHPWPRPSPSLPIESPRPVSWGSLAQAAALPPPFRDLADGSPGIWSPVALEFRSCIHAACVFIWEMGSGQMRRSRGSKPSAWPMNFKARWREGAKPLPMSLPQGSSWACTHIPVLPFPLHSPR